MRHFQAELAPFVNEPGANDLIGLIDVAIEEVKLQVLLARRLL